MSWQKLRESCGSNNPGLCTVADTFEDAGFEFLSYSALSIGGREVAVLRFTNFLGDRFAVFTGKGLGLGLARFTNSGEMIPVRVSLQAGEELWNAIVRATLLC